MVPEERYKKFSRSVLKNETERDIAATFKELVAEFSNARAAVGVRPAKCVGPVAKSKQALQFFTFGQLP
jgi:hypothetical protein